MKLPAFLSPPPEPGIPAIIVRAHLNATLCYIDFLIAGKVSPEEKEKIQAFQDNDAAFKLMTNMDNSWRQLKMLKANRGLPITAADISKFYDDWIGAVRETEKFLPKLEGK